MHCTKTKFALYKDDIKMNYDLRSNGTTFMLRRVCMAFLLSNLIATLTYILMDNFLSLFSLTLGTPAGDRISVKKRANNLPVVKDLFNLVSDEATILKT